MVVRGWVTTDAAPCRMSVDQGRTRAHGVNVQCAIRAGIFNQGGAGSRTQAKKKRGENNKNSEHVHPYTTENVRNHAKRMKRDNRGPKASRGAERRVESK